MKTILLALVALGGAITTFAQTDTTGTANNKADTIKIGGMIIIRKPGSKEISRDSTYTTHRRKQLSNVSTNWFIVDLGFVNYNDKTNYASAAAQQFAPGSNKDWFNLRTGKSVNVNFWLFMQKLNLAEHFLNFKYGLGVELNNYRFDDENILFQKNPTKVVYNSTMFKSIEKNKLAADYVTVPAMINFNFNPTHKTAFGFSAGISAGYLFSARQKIKSDGGKKEKLHDDFDLNKWKLSYIGELNLGPLRLYGSYAFKNMWEKGLDQTPYTVGIRFSNF